MKSYRPSMHEERWPCNCIKVTVHEWLYSNYIINMHILCLIFSWVRNITIVTVPLLETSSNMYKRSEIKMCLYNTVNKRVKISKRACHARTESCCSLSSVTSSRLQVVYSQKRKNILFKNCRIITKLHPHTFWTGYERYYWFGDMQKKQNRYEYSRKLYTELNNIIMLPFRIDRLEMLSCLDNTIRTGDTLYLSCAGKADIESLI